MLSHEPPPNSLVEFGKGGFRLSGSIALLALLYGGSVGGRMAQFFDAYPNPYVAMLLTAIAWSVRVFA